jgi:hypothetical protein
MTSSSSSSHHHHHQNHHDQEIFFLSLNATDLLRISPAEPTLEKVVAEAIVKAWPRGLQASQHKLHDQVAEYKLRGDPWLPTGVLDVMPQGGPLILALLRGVIRAGFRVQTSIDMSRVSLDTHAIVLRRDAPVDLSEAGDLFGLWLFGSDTILAYEAPNDLISGGIEEIIGKHWSKGLQSKKTDTETHVTRFKLHGNFLLCEGDEAVQARLFMANFHNELLKRGFECFASLDVCKSNICQDFMVFRRITPH